ncbi:MAG: MFS transporter, partial [Rhodococcus sp. (in: high G+C Gram-positive bacteria)]|nr:MFS transporter [Rhodococcus sp. (in: high G+C Gram-positive bacteria)]
MDQNPGHDTSPPEYSTKQARKAGITAFVGTTIEWFDFYIYGTASALVLGPL